MECVLYKIQNAILKLFIFQLLTDHALANCETPVRETLIILVNENVFRFITIFLPPDDKNPRSKFRNMFSVTSITLIRR